MNATAQQLETIYAAYAEVGRRVGSLLMTHCSDASRLDQQRRETEHLLTSVQSVCHSTLIYPSIVTL